MSPAQTQSDPEFDQYAVEYDDALSEGLSVSGEDKTYFAQGRVVWLAKCLERAKARAGAILDFGCGTGTSTPYLLGLPGADSVLGVDVSAKSLEVARRSYGSDRAEFLDLGGYAPGGGLDLAFCNGVFHHIPLHLRGTSIDCVYKSLRPGGLFSFWENNPWNPGTRWVMSRIPFDRDAITIPPPEARRLLEAGGFEVLRTDFHFIFPKLLFFMRWSECLVRRLPLGAQYQVLCRKPGVSQPA